MAEGHPQRPHQTLLETAFAEQKTHHERMGESKSRAVVEAISAASETGYYATFVVAYRFIFVFLFDLGRFLAFLLH